MNNVSMRANQLRICTNEYAAIQRTLTMQVKSTMLLQVEQEIIRIQSKGQREAT